MSRKADQLVCSNSRNVQNNTFEFAAAAGCWNEAEIGGRKCASIQFEQNVVERFGKVDAWIDGVRVLCRPPRGQGGRPEIRRPKPHNASAPEVMGANKVATTSVVRL